MVNNSAFERSSFPLQTTASWACHSAVLLTLATGIVGISGCGTGKPTAPTAAAPVNDGSASPPAITTPEHIESPASAVPTVQNDNPPAEVAPLSANSTATDQVSAPPQAGSPPKQKVPEPTAQQIASWAQPEFEPLQLLACRESSELGLVSHLAHARDGRQFITAGSKVVLWDLSQKSPVHVFLELSGEQTIKSLAVAPNGKWFAVGDSEGMLRLWSIADRTEVISKQIHNNDIVQIAISPNGQEIATIGYGKEIAVWNAQQLQQLKRFEVDTDSLSRIEYLSDDVLAAAGQTTSCWNVRTGKLEKPLSHGRYNYTLARSADGSLFLCGEDETLQIWKTDAIEMVSTVGGGFATKELVEFSEHATHLATANGSSMRLWDLKHKQIVQAIDTFGWPITGLSWLPKSNLLVVSSLNGRIRIWGTPSDGKAFEMQPMHANVVMPDRESREPATPPQLLAAMDLRVFPVIPGAVTNVKNEFSLMYECADSIDEAKAFNRYHLARDGWSEVEQPIEMPHMISFQKDGFRLTTSYYDGSQLKTTVSISFGGNYDMRWIPKLDGAPIEVVFENEDTVMYRTKADVVQIETALLRQLHAAGWTAYATLNSSHDEVEDVRHLTFLRGSMTLNVSISRTPADPDSFTVQCGRNLETKSVPVPADSGFVEFDGSTEPLLVATTAMNLEQARAFYDAEMAAAGWLAREFGRNTRDKDRNWLAYIRGQQDVSVGLQSLPDGRTLVRIGDDLEQSSWQLAKETPPAATDSTAAVGIEAVDFPILNESKTAKYDAIAQELEFSMDSTPLLKVGELYTQEMQTLGWKTEGGIRADDYVFLTFEKEDQEIALRARVNDGKSIVNIQGDGILWNKPLPGGKRIISYETWLRINRLPATLDLIDRYQNEMR